MRVTNRLRAKYPMLADEQIAKTIAWNRQYANAQIKSVCKYVFGTILVALAALLSASAIAGIAAMIYNCFII